MNRRSVLGLIASLPFCGWAKPTQENDAHLCTVHSTPNAKNWGPTLVGYKKEYTIYISRSTYAYLCDVDKTGGLDE